MLAAPFFIVNIVHLGIINVLVSKLLHSSSSRERQLRNCAGKLKIACLPDGSTNSETVRGIYTLVWSHLKHFADVCLSHSLRSMGGGGYTAILVWSHANLRLSHILYGDSWNIKNKCTAAAMFDSWLSRSTNVYFYEHFFHPFIFTYAYTQVTNKYLIIHSCWSRTHWAIIAIQIWFLLTFLFCYTTWKAIILWMHWAIYCIRNSLTIRTYLLSYFDSKGIGNIQHMDIQNNFNMSTHFKS